MVKTGLEEWKPRLAEHRCRCRDDRYHLRRWIKVDGFWEYHYVCHLVRSVLSAQCRAVPFCSLLSSLLFCSVL